MIVVVADTSPLNYLVQVHCQDLLPALYERLFVPQAVIQELTHTRTPTAVQDWARHLPAWLKVREVQSSADQELAGLDQGEREAIQLAQEERADLLLIDEKAGAKLARRRGIEVTGTLGGRSKTSGGHRCCTKQFAGNRLPMHASTAGAGKASRSQLMNFCVAPRSLRLCG